MSGGLFFLVSAASEIRVHPDDEDGRDDQLDTLSTLETMVMAALLAAERPLLPLVSAVCHFGPSALSRRRRPVSAPASLDVS